MSFLLPRPCICLLFQALCVFMLTHSRHCSFPPNAFLFSNALPLNCYEGRLNRCFQVLQLVLNVHLEHIPVSKVYLIAYLSHIEIFHLSFFFIFWAHLCVCSSLSQLELSRLFRFCIRAPSKQLWGDEFNPTSSSALSPFLGSAGASACLLCNPGTYSNASGAKQDGAIARYAQVHTFQGDRQGGRELSGLAGVTLLGKGPKPLMTCIHHSRMMGGQHTRIESEKETISVRGTP